MKLMTQALRKSLPKLYSQETVADPMVMAKFFNPAGTGTWYVLEFDGEDIFFGAVDLGMTDEPELGTFSLSELEGVQVRGLKIERDLYFEPVRLSSIIPSRATQRAG